MNCKILTYKDIDRAEWTALVQSSTTGTWFQTPEAYAFFSTQTDVMEPFVFGLQQSAISHQALCAVCVGYVTKEKSAIRQYFTRRAIIIGGPVIADDATCEEVKFLMEAVRQRLQILDFRFKILNSPIYIETRNFNDYSRWKEAFERAGFAYQPHLNFHVDCSDEKKMWERLSETRQKQIRRARRSGVKIIEPGEKEIKEWYLILRNMYKQKVKTPLWPVEFFIDAYRNGTAKYLMVWYEEKVIGGLMLEEDEKCVYEWFACGQDAGYERQYPSVMAAYAGMEYANVHGKGRCDLMGAGVPGVPYGVRDFKERFGGSLVEHGRFLHVRKPWLYRLGTWGVKMMKR